MSTIHKGLDTTANTVPHIKAIKSAGYSFVARYMSHSTWKNATPTETQALSHAGLSVVSVWESAGDHASFFTRIQGRLDGSAAYLFAKHIGQPLPAPIYFAVDYDADPAHIREYFKGVRDGLNGVIGHTMYNVGVYGSGAVCADLKAQGLVSYTWLAQSGGWSGSRTYTDWNLRQLPTLTFAGMDCDGDESRGNGGGWQVS